jgi:uncharacterized damage-inducible protein DinB
VTKRAILLQALASTPRDIERLLRALPPEGRQWQPRDDWSVQQVLAHLIDAESILRARLERTRREDNPDLPRYDPHDHAEPPAPLAASGSLQAFVEARRRTLDFLTDLKPGEWQRPASGNRNGATTLRWQVVDMMNHDLAHLGQLVDIRVKWEAGDNLGGQRARNS